MTTHDLYVISPYIAVAGVAVLVILLDLVVPRKGLLPVFAFLGLLAPFALSLIQAFDLRDALNLVQGADPLSTAESSVLLGSLSVDRFALFFNFLVLAAVGPKTRTRVVAIVGIGVYPSLLTDVFAMGLEPMVAVLRGGG